ncbi:unnamed protein product [Prorocentrum cordatum]|uniref:Ubiquitinyl hydrolase 1 n=1 Tax=Prorocentrum cordatum TaxID=2364126 RepID=A0ABN9TC94_9DINO|nr:unnamed protein product [Polarella glacialis]
MIPRAISARTEEQRVIMREYIRAGQWCRKISTGNRWQRWCSAAHDWVVAQQAQRCIVLKKLSPIGRARQRTGTDGAPAAAGRSADEEETASGAIPAPSLDGILSDMDVGELALLERACGRRRKAIRKATSAGPAGPPLRHQGGEPEKGEQPDGQREGEQDLCEQADGEVGGGQASQSGDLPWSPPWVLLPPPDEEWRPAANRSWACPPHPDFPVPTDVPPMASRPERFNSIAGQAVSRSGVQLSATCGLHSFNHCVAPANLARLLPARTLSRPQFETAAFAAGLGGTRANLIDARVGNYECGVLACNS